MFSFHFHVMQCRVKTPGEFRFSFRETLDFFFILDMKWFIYKVILTFWDNFETDQD